MPLVLLEKECGPKCRSRKHVLEIISLIARCNLKEFQAYSKLCYNWAKHSDPFNRTALHLAASCGKTDILEWLLEENLMDLSAKDSESGYTALHRALLYGQLASARLLVQVNQREQTMQFFNCTILTLPVPIVAIVSLQVFRRGTLGLFH